MDNWTGVNKRNFKFNSFKFIFYKIIKNNYIKYKNINNLFKQVYNK